MKNSKADELRSYWKKQMADEDHRAIENLRRPAEHQTQTADVRATVGWADEHLFARRSVVNDYELKSAALARGRGENFDLADLDRAIAERDYCRFNGAPHKLASRELAGCEDQIGRAVQTGANTFFDLCRDYKPEPGLSAEQVHAAQKILKSHDFVTLFRGGAGTGKTHTLKEIERAIASTDRPVLVLAPQRQQVLDLESAGMRAQTLAHALSTNQFAPHSVVILDEAGQVGSAVSGGCAMKPEYKSAENEHDGRDDQDDRIQRMIEGLLSTGESEAFKRAVVSDPALRAAYAERVWMHGLLRAEGERLPLLLGAPEEPAGREMLQVTTEEGRGGALTRKRGMSFWSGWLAALAAAVALGFVMSRAREMARPRTVATLVQAQNTKWAGSTLPTLENSKLGPGTLALVEGVATLKFDSGAMVTLEAPTRLEILNAMNCRRLNNRYTASTDRSLFPAISSTSQSS